MKQLLHRKSEAESAKNLANWQIYPVFFLAASPEILLFLPPVDITPTFPQNLEKFHFRLKGLIMYI